MPTLYRPRMRALQVHLTARGEALAQRVHQVSWTLEDELLRVLSPAGRAMLRELLVKLASGKGPMEAHAHA